MRYKPGLIWYDPDVSMKQWLLAFIVASAIPLCAILALDRWRFNPVGIVPVLFVAAFPKVSFVLSAFVVLFVYGFMWHDVIFLIVGCAATLVYGFPLASPWVKVLGLRLLLVGLSLFFMYRIGDL